jgi:pyruvate dehydrogenase E2 component (dihydrolipoyllysine-residue acetyltransferase)
LARAIVMPSLGMYTAEGKLVKWLKAGGERVEAGEPVCEIETEKAVYEVEAAVAGVLHRVAELGANLPVEALIGYVLAEGETPPAPTLRGSAKSMHAPVVRPAAKGVGVAEPARGEAHASPMAKRLAADYGVDLTRIRGSGPGGRIVEADVRATMLGTPGNAAVAAPTIPHRIRERIPMAGIRATIAQRLRHSLATAASLTLTREVRAQALVVARTRLQEVLSIEVPYDALFVKIFALALREHPVFNSIIENDAILVLDELHIGFAVAVPGGLIVPVIRDAEHEPLSKIAAGIRELSGRALASKLRPEDVTGGTASISNLGAYGVDAFTPILNPPQSSILGIGRIMGRPVVEGGAIVPAPTCILSLTFDHRVADGAPAAQLLDFVACRMDDPQFLQGLGKEG